MAKKLYTSASIDFTFEGTRAEAIKACIAYLANRESVKAGCFSGRFTWRADDESGFTLKIDAVNFTVTCAQKWNAARW